MKILVTGGAGFIGANFLRMHVPRCPDHAFVNVDALTYAANLASLEDIAGAPNYRFVRADIADAAAVDALFDEQRPDAVIHFAAESHVDRSIAGPRAFVRTNIEGTFNLLEAARRTWRRGEGLFHHVSTDEVYGSLGRVRPLHRGDALRPVEPVLREQGGERPPRARVSPHVRAAGEDHELLEQLRSAPVSGEADPA